MANIPPKELPVALTIQEIIDTDPDWIAWAADTIEWFKLDDEAIEAVDQALFGQDDNSDKWTGQDDIPGEYFYDRP